MAEDENDKPGGPDEDATPTDDAPSSEAVAEEAAAEVLSDEDLEILDAAQHDLVAEMREDMLRARAELVNFRNRVERDRQANREAAIAEVLRALLPALDDLDRAEAHGDIAEGTPMEIIATKLRSSFARFGLTPFGAKGDPFDPAMHEAIFQQPTPGADSQTILDVVEVGYRFGDRVVRPAKVAVAVPADE